jgi:arabinan endo-1,5-alpha-L-arabinosidase
MERIVKYLVMALLCLNITGVAQTPVVHDPVMIKEGSTYYLFCTGMGISVFSSTDMETWKREASVFSAPPTWAIDAVQGFKGHIWAPDITYRNGEYYLYYSVSAFGKNTSCIGVATNKTLNPADKNFRWIDRGKVIESIPGRDLWNAIDPNLIIDSDDKPWMVFGSFWGGMKLVRLKDDLKEIATPQEWYTVSRRSRDFKVDDRDPGEGAVEAPFIFKKNGFYYLFVSFDFCCRGANSNYKVVVGRSDKIQGPYRDKNGNRLDEGGGTLVIEGDKDWAGVGHNSVYTFDKEDILVFHGYDMKDGGKPKLRIEKLTWDENGWPVIGKNKL